MKNKEWIKVIGAKEHNLKNINVQIPKNSLTVITGPSGSGKARSLLIFYIQKASDDILNRYHPMQGNF